MPPSLRLARLFLTSTGHQEATIEATLAFVADSAMCSQWVSNQSHVCLPNLFNLLNFINIHGFCLACSSIPSAHGCHFGDEPSTKSMNGVDTPRVVVCVNHIDVDDHNNHFNGFRGLVPAQSWEIALISALETKVALP